MAYRKFAVAAGAASLFLGSVAFSADRTWFGGDGIYQTAANWSPNGIPTTTDRVFMNSGVATIVSGFTISGGLCSDAFIGDEPGSDVTIRINEANPPTVGGGFRAEQHAIFGNRGSGRLHVSGTRTSFSAHTVSLGAQPGGSGTLGVSGSLFVSMSMTDVYVGGSPAGPGGTGRLTATGLPTSADLYVYGTAVVYPGGSIHVAGGGNQFNHVRVDGGRVSSSTIPFGGGSMRLDGTFTMNAGTGDLGLSAKELRVSGGTFDRLDASISQNVYITPAAGATTPAELNMLSGDLNVTGSVFVGSTGPAFLRSVGKIFGGTNSLLNISEQGILTAADTFRFPRGVDSSGTIQPNGDAKGELRPNARLRLFDESRLELSIHEGLTSDVIVSTAAIELDGLLAANFAAATAPTSLGQSLPIITGQITGRFDNPNDRLIVGEREFEIQYTTNTVRIVDVGAVPEPAGLLAFSGVLLVRRLRASSRG